VGQSKLGGFPLEKKKPQRTPSERQFVPSLEKKTMSITKNRDCSVAGPPRKGRLLPKKTRDRKRGDERGVHQSSPDASISGGGKRRGTEKVG